MKLSTLFIVLGIAVTLTGCATSRGKPVNIVGGNRAAGVVQIGYVHTSNIPLIDNGENANWGDAHGLAMNVCKRWGYENAELMTRFTRTEGRINGYGQLLNGVIYVQYQCYGGKAAEH